MFKVHLQLFFLCLVLSINKIESRNIKKIFGPVYQSAGQKVVKTEIITKWLLHKANKFLLLASFMLLAKPQIQNATKKEEIVKNPESVEPINIVPYPRIG